LYYENKLDNMKEVDFIEIFKGYNASEYNTDDYPTERGLSLYIASKDGLNSSYDEDAFEELLTFRMNNEEIFVK
jgi:hypothetical protein